MPFVHLHTHTHYTFQQALGDPERLAKRAKELEQGAVAITDAGNMYGAFEFYEACKKNDIKPIIGVEFLISKKGRRNRDKDNEIYEIVLLAKNYAGYKNLIELVTLSQIEGYWNGKPRIDFDLLEQFHNDLIALSGSMYGEIGQMIITGKSDINISERIGYYRELFGKEHYYLELEEHADKPMQSKINETILRLSKEYGYEYVGTNNAYYIAPDDADVQDMMAAVSVGRELDDPDRTTLMGGDYSIRSSREMEELFVYAPKAYENTQKIADMIDLQIDYGSYKIPKFPLSDEEKVRYEKFQKNIISTQGEVVSSPPDKGGSPTVSVEDRGVGFGISPLVGGCRVATGGLVSEQPPLPPLSEGLQEQVSPPTPPHRGASGLSKYQLLATEEWLLRTMCIGGLNFRYDFDIDESDQEILLQKLSIPKPEKKISSMSVEELYMLAESYYSEEKKSLIATWDERKKSIIRRLEYELLVVELMGFNGYFCIVADFIRYGKGNGVPVGPGRGSAAGAILAYLSGITDIDPLKYGLLFERFLNPARVSMPDIDVDFSDEGRDKVLTYVREKYGKDHVTQVCTFGTLAARAAVKDAGRALGVPFQDMNDFAKLIPGRPGITLKEALEESTELKKSYEEIPQYTKVIDAAIKLEGTVRQLGVHACAVIIAPEPMTHFCPLQPPPKDPTTTVTQFSAGPLEALGLLKMDFLGLRNLAILSRAVEIVEEVHQAKVDLLKIDYEDQKVLSLFGEGDMTGVFQFESAGMRRYLKELKPSSFEDLIAMVSLYRPGPLQYIPEFIDRKFGRKIVEYPHPSLEEILKPTYGIAVYQEQIMQLVQAFAGFSLGEADILRRAIGKKKYELLMEQRGKFIDAALREGHKEDLAIYIFDEIIEPFAGYGFNKSHAACYSMIAYQTAYMKTYYPTEFMTALMISDEEDIDRIRMEIEEAGMKSVTILPPDVNESRKHFTFVDNSHIRFGMKAIKGLGENPIETIYNASKEQKFTSIEDFIERTGGDVINKKSLESLIFAGALDAFGERNSLLASIPKMTAYLKENESKKETSQMGLFDMGESAVDHGMDFELVRAEPMTFEARMKGEKAMIGYPVSGHPLDGIEDFIKQKSKNIGMVYTWLDEKEEKRMLQNAGPILSEEEGIENNVPVTARNEAIQEIDRGAPDISDASNPPVRGGRGGSVSDISEAPLPKEEGVGAPEEKPNRIQSGSNTDYGEEPVYATLIGLVGEVRKLQTKSGGMMLMAKVESVGFDFRVIVFSRDFETYENKVQEDTIIAIEGRLKFDLERDEISMSPGAGFGKKGTKSDAIKTFTITQFREFAEGSQGSVIARIGDRKDQLPTASNRQTATDSRYFIDIPSYWTKEDLLDLKDYLTHEPVGLTPIWIRVNGIEKNTKFTIDNIAGLEEWVGKRGI